MEGIAMKCRLLMIALLTVALCVVACSQDEPDSEEITGSVTDIDGNVYTTVKIGNQWWTAENLRTTHYQNGDEIPNVIDGDEWRNLISGAYGIYEHEPDNAPIYGLHYNYFAASDGRGICPEGWHVPSDEEWMVLEEHLGMSHDERDSYGWRGSDEGGKLKKPDLDRWEGPLIDASNETGFSALPSGGRASDTGFQGQFWYQKEHLAAWSSDEYSDAHAIFRTIEHDQPGIQRQHYNKQNGFSIRCIQD